MSNVRIAAVGDVMCGESFYRYRCGPRSHIECLGPDFMPRAVQELLHAHDIVFGNVECVLSDVGYRPRRLRSHQMRGRPQSAVLLREWGFTLINVANNHILEHGRAAALDTVERLRTAELAVIGAGRNACLEAGFEPYEFEVRGARIGALGACLLSETYAFDGGGTAAALLSTTTALARRCDIVLVSLHWGTEYMPYPNDAQRATARLLVDAGATLVIGHHPHIVQGVERVGNALVAYSLGNFIFDQLPPCSRSGIILSCAVTRRTVCSHHIHEFTLDERHRPMLVQPHGSAAGVPPPAPQACTIPPPMPQVEYVREQCRHRATARRELHRYIWRAMWRWPPSIMGQALLRPIQRRIGLW